MLKQDIFFNVTLIIQINHFFSDCLDGLAIQRLFVFLKENLNFESLQNELNRRNLLSEKNTKDYVYNIPGERFRVEKLLKLIIKKRKCTEFLTCLHEMAIHNHIWEKIREFKEDQQTVQKGNVIKVKTLYSWQFLCVENDAHSNLRISNL